jgi:hypothetical protein
VIGQPHRNHGVGHVGHSGAKKQDAITEAAARNQDERGRRAMVISGEARKDARALPASSDAGSVGGRPRSASPKLRPVWQLSDSPGVNWVGVGPHPHWASSANVNAKVRVVLCRGECKDATNLSSRKRVRQADEWPGG